jgi:ketosteroid isomerase-like protein
MSEHPNVTLYRETMEMFMAGDQSAAEVLADDVVWHQIGAETLHGRQAVLESMGGLDDIEFDVEIHDVVANDDHVIGLLVATIDAGDGPFTYRSAEIAHVREGKVTERWAFSDDTQAIADYFSTHGQ